MMRVCYIMKDVGLWDEQTKSDADLSLQNLQLPLELGSALNTDALEQHLLRIALDSPIVLLLHTHCLSYFICGLNYKPLEG